MPSTAHAHGTQLVTVCTEGSCLHARPGTPCHCTSCFGADHGAHSTLTPAACHGTKTLIDPNPTGGYRYTRCPGCADCARAPIPAPRRAADPLVGLPTIDDDPFGIGTSAGRPGLAAVAFGADGWPLD